MPPFKFVNQGELTWLSFSALDFPNLKHGVFLRDGGVSRQPFASLNVGLHTGDSPSKVDSNRNIIKNCLSVRFLLSARQVHSNSVFHLTNLPVEDLEVEAQDSLITNVKDILLMVQQADCQAVLLYDPIHHAIGIAHVGWRGSVNDVLPKTISVMSKEFKSQPAEIIAAVSPSLGPCCAEFKNFNAELPLEFHGFQNRPYYFDFQAISRWQMITSGLKPENISIAKICTRCDERFFSYRRESTTGRSASVIGLC